MDLGTAGHRGEDSDDDDVGEEGGLDASEQRARRAAEAGARPPLYNAEGLHERLEDISWPAEVPYSASLPC